MTPNQPPLPRTPAEWAEASRSGRFRDETCGLRPLEWFFEQAMAQARREMLPNLNPPPQDVPDVTSTAA